MKINQLSQDLIGLLDQYTYLRQPQADVFTYQLHRPRVHMVENVLYIFSEKNIPTAEPSLLSLNLLIQVAGDVPQGLLQLRSKYPNSNLIFCKGVENIFTLLEMVSSSFLAENRNVNYYNQLLMAYQKNQGLEALVDTFYAILHSPVVIMDVGYKILAMHTDNAGADNFGLAQQKTTGFMSEDNLNRMRNDRILEKLRESPDGCLYSSPSGTDFHWFDALVYLHGIEVAEIGVLETDHKFTRFDMELISFFRTLVSWEIARGDFFAPSKGLMHNLFLSELLNQTFVNEAEIEKRRSRLGWDDCRNYRVLTIFADTRKNFTSRAEILVSHLVNIMPSSHWLITDTDIMLLLLFPSRQETGSLPRDQIEGLLERHQLEAILSNSFDSLKSLRKYYNETKDVHEFLKYDTAGRHLHEYQDLSLYYMAKKISETGDLKDFCHPVVAEIRQYDLENHTDYLKTLTEYLLHPEDPALSSSNLSIHKNTFFYRMARIRELFPVNLEDGLSRAKLLLTLEFLKITAI